LQESVALVAAQDDLTVLLQWIIADDRGGFCISCFQRLQMVCPVSSPFFSLILLAETFCVFCTPLFFAATVLLSQLLLCRTPTFFFWKLLHLCRRYSAVLVASFLTATAMTVSSIHVFRRPKRSALRDLCGCTVRFPTISPRTTCKGTADASTGQLQKARAHEGGCSESVLILGGNGSNKVLAAVSEADSHGRKTATTIFCHRPQCITNRVKACSYIFVSTKGINTRKPFQPQNSDCILFPDVPGERAHDSRPRQPYPPTLDARSRS